MRLMPLLVALLVTTFRLPAQNSMPAPEKPKLVVGLVIDQMRYDFLYRYQSKYGTGGFKRLLREGYSCENTHINYSPSYTACGHTCVYTGSVPAIHGITGNDWYDYEAGAMVYCTQDTAMRTVGSPSGAGKMSPNRLLPTTITDELRLATNYRGKTIGVAIKDRSSILPAGHAANAAYFYDPSAGAWITSTYYMKELPLWVQEFNAAKWPEKFLSGDWKTLLDSSAYWESTPDDEPWEGTFDNEMKPIFTHKVSSLTNPSYKILAGTPFGNSVTLKFAEGAVLNEQLGADNITDFLAVSLSSTDYIGHRFGPNSVEAEDCYLRLDQDLAEFFTFLDTRIGKGNYVLFLTADHGTAHSPGFLNEHKIPAGVFPIDTILQGLDKELNRLYGDTTLLLSYENMQLYLNNKVITDKKIDKAGLKSFIKNYLLQYNGVSKVLDLENLANENVPTDLKQKISNGVFAKRSGDLFILHEPGWFEGFTKGTTHGTIYPYDTHIPLVWMGWKIPHAEDHSEIHMTDIAPTVAALLHIQEPSGNIGKVITGIVK